MTSGGHARSGPNKDPNALRRDKDNFTFRQLPRTPYAGPVPQFPLPQARITALHTEDKRSWTEFDPEASEARNRREADLWSWAWSLPQAHVWAEDSWRLLDIAMWVRTQAVCETVEASAADKNSLHRFACKIGLGPDGLKENAWAISRDETAAWRTDAAPVASIVSAKDRLKLAAGS